MAKFKYNKAGRYQQGSLLNEQKRRHAPSGGYENDGKPWTHEEDNRLLEEFLVECLPIISGNDKRSLVDQFKRSSESVEWRLRNMAADHPKAKYVFIAEFRTDRSGKQWTDRDRWLIEKSMTKGGRQRRANTAEWLSKILGRSVREVQTFLWANYPSRETRPVKGLGL